MILADKIIQLRKKRGWTQEELAERMNVTRQSVSKWEGAQSVPDLEKIVLMSQIFDVSTDVLLKEELEAVEEPGATGETQTVRRLTLQEAEEFLRLRAWASVRIAGAAFLCILSPICLIMLGGAQAYGALAITEKLAGGIGLVVLFLMILPAVAVFITVGSKCATFEFIEQEVFETEYTVLDLVRERQNQYRETYTRSNDEGSCICIFSVVPLFSSLFLTENELVYCAALSITILLAGIGTMFFITAGVKWASMEKLLQEGDYSKQRKKNSTFTRVIGAVYWLVVTAGYLAWGLLTANWKTSWIVWPVAGVLFAAVMIACSARQKQN